MSENTCAGFHPDAINETAGHEPDLAESRRFEALKLAVTCSPNESYELTVKRAEAYVAFLKGDA